MTVRVLEEKDIPLLCGIETVCFPDAWSVSTWQSAFARSDFFGWIAEEAGTAIGFVCGTSVWEESELLKIAVLPAFRGKGLGNVLLKTWIDAAKKGGAEKMFLEVREGNVAALRLYEKQLFQVTRLRKKYYEDGENALEMVKEL